MYSILYFCKNRSRFEMYNVQYWSHILYEISCFSNIAVSFQPPGCDELKNVSVHWGESCRSASIAPTDDTWNRKLLSVNIKRFNLAFHNNLFDISHEVMLVLPVRYQISCLLHRSGPPLSLCMEEDIFKK